HFKLMLTDSPVYLTAPEPNDILRAAAAWERAPMEICQNAPGIVSLAGTSTPLVRGEPRRVIPLAQTVAGVAGVSGVTLRQETIAIVTNPVAILPLSATSTELVLRLQSIGESFNGFVEIEDSQGVTLLDAINFKGETTSAFRIKSDPAKDGYSIRLLDKDKNPVL